MTITSQGHLAGSHEEQGVVALLTILDKDWAEGPAVAELPGEGGMDPEKRPETLLPLGRK